LTVRPRLLTSIQTTKQWIVKPGKQWNIRPTYSYRFAAKRLFFTGEGPFWQVDLIELLPAACQCYRMNFDYQAKRTPAPIDAVIIGEHDWSTRAIEAPLETVKRPPRFLPQEAFVDEVVYGCDWWRHAEDVPLLYEALKWSPGLAYAKSLSDTVVADFAWPTTDTAESDGLSSVSADYQLESELRRLGYQIQDRSDDERWRALQKAVVSFELKYVAYFIASLVR
jgi:hypothetical protein